MQASKPGTAYTRPSVCGWRGSGQSPSRRADGQEEKITEQEWEYNTLSLPETHTQQGWTSENDRLGPSGGYTTKAEYDALGLTKANEYSDGRRLEHNYDGLNRLQQTDDDTNLVTVASYLYSGSRLIEREYGNGIKTTYEYESSGCGCGGFSGMVESVKHTAGLTTLFQTERRFPERSGASLRSVRFANCAGQRHGLRSKRTLAKQCFVSECAGPTRASWARCTVLTTPTG